MSNAKAEIRQNLKVIRQGLTISEVTTASQIIAKRLLEDFDWRNICSVHIYKPITKLNEIDTTGILSQLADKYPRMKTVIAGQDSNSTIPTELYDAIIVPVLAFNGEKHRLGWGGGWYDRFLAQQSQALKIGLAYEFSKIAGPLPKQPHDIKLDKIITEKQVY